MPNLTQTYRNDDFIRLNSLVHECYYDVSNYQEYSQKVSTGEAKKLTFSAGLMQLLCDHNTKNQVKKLGFDGVMTSEELRLFVLAYVEKKAEEEKVYYPALTVKKRPITLSGLINKLTRFRKIGFKSLLSRRLGNQNALKITKKAARLLNGLDTLEEAKYLHSKTYSEYMLVALGAKEFTSEDGELFSKDDNLPFLSLTTIKRFLSSSLNKIGNARRKHGKKYLNDKYRPYVPGEKPTYSGSMLAGDGQTAPFFLLDRNGKKTWTRPSVYFVFDYTTQAILSFRFALSSETMDENLEDTRQGLYQAFRAMNFKKPGEIVLDNFGQTQLEDDLGLMTDHLHFITKGNSQENPAERLIGMFDTAQLRNVKGWLGGGIRNKKQNQRPNPDRKTVYYTIEEMQAIYAREVEKWNKKRLKKFYKQLNPGLKNLDTRILTEVFGRNTNVTLDRGLANLQFENTKYSFEVADYDGLLAKNAVNGARVRIKYLPDSLETGVYAYRFDRYDIKNTAHDVFLAHLPPVRKSQKAQVEQTEQDKRDLGHNLNRKKAFDEFVKAHEEDTPVLSEVIPKLSKKEAETVLMSAAKLDKGLLKRAKEALSGGDNDLLHGSDWDGVEPV